MTTMMQSDPRARVVTVDAVVIGRNEGDRLRRCLESIAPRGRDASAVRVIYVDSGSTDGSVALARSMGAEVVELDMSLPFTAARGRNAGFARSTSEFVQFIDGDCEIRPGWLERAVREMQGEPRTVVVFGRLRERFPERSIYNRLSDVEWETLVGEAPFCGGIAMMRADAVRGAGAFDETIVAGEEPELCARLRSRGGVIRSVDAEMCFHDAAITRFGQWWRRQVRSGFGMSEVTFRLWRSGQRHFVRSLVSSAVWGFGWPAAVVASALCAGLGLCSGWVCAGVGTLAPLAVLRIAQRGSRRGLSKREAMAFGVLTMLSKSAIAWGAIKQLTSARGDPRKGDGFHKDPVALEAASGGSP